MVTQMPNNTIVNLTAICYNQFKMNEKKGFKDSRVQVTDLFLSCHSDLFGIVPVLNLSFPQSFERE
jgi:hypothetical protein